MPPASPRHSAHAQSGRLAPGTDDPVASTILVPVDSAGSSVRRSDPFDTISTTSRIESRAHLSPAHPGTPGPRLRAVPRESLGVGVCSPPGDADSAVDAAHRAHLRAARFPAAAGERGGVAADRAGRERRDAAGQRARPGADRLSREGQALDGPRVGRDQRTPPGAGQAAGRLPGRLLGRVGHVPQDPVPRVRRRVPSVRGAGSPVVRHGVHDARRQPLGPAGVAARACRTSGSTPGGRSRPRGSSASAAGTASCRSSSSGRTGRTASGSTTSSAG